MNYPPDDIPQAIHDHYEREAERLADNPQYTIIGWISRDMNTYRVDPYKAMFGAAAVRIPPKIYKTEQVASRYGKAIPVYVRTPTP